MLPRASLTLSIFAYGNFEVKSSMNVFIKVSLFPSTSEKSFRKTNITFFMTGGSRQVVNDSETLTVI